MNYLDKIKFANWTLINELRRIYKVKIEGSTYCIENKILWTKY